jgi:hypothetical protein
MYLTVLAVYDMFFQSPHFKSISLNIPKLGSSIDEYSCLQCAKHPHEKSCDTTVDKDGITQIKIECSVSEEEKQGAWKQLRIKHATDCSLSAEPIWLAV